MRTISMLSFIIGLFVAGLSVWRWSSGYVYDSPFKTLVGLFVALSIMAWAHVIDWMTRKDEETLNLAYRIDSIQFPPKTEIPQEKLF